MNKNLVIVIVIVIVLVLAGVGLWYWQSGRLTPYSTTTTFPSETVSAPAPQTPAEDTTAMINKALNNVDFGDLDREFQVIDTDLNSL